jgi:hypothetical protein
VQTRRYLEHLRTQNRFALKNAEHVSSSANVTVVVLKCKVITLIFCHNLIFCHISSAIFVRAFQHLLNLGTVHYLHPGLVLKRYGLGNQVFDLLIGWVKKIKAVYQL